MQSTLLAFSALVAGTAFAAPVTKDGPYGWTAVQAADGTRRVTMSFSLWHDEGVEDAVNAKFTSVSDPKNKDYANYLSVTQLAALSRPCPKASAKAWAWCRKFQGATCTPSGTGDVFRVTMNADIVEKALNVRLGLFTHPLAPKRAITRTLDTVVLSDEIAEFAQCVFGLDMFPILNERPQVRASAGNEITPALLQGPTLYNITDKASADSKASMAVAEFQGQAFLPSDLAKFESAYGIAAQPVRRVIGGPDADKSAGVEASLDIQYIIATGPGVPADFYLHDGNDFDLMGWATAVLADSNSALVWSVSYGEGVNGGNGGVIQPATAHQLNFQLQKFALRGMSVLVASGDSGVYNRLPFEKTKFHPSYPSCLPAVTSVGATQLDDGVEDSGVSFSGGGFTPAEYYVRATNSSWQSEAVNAYLTSSVKLPPADLWDRTGRGLPDVSAVGVDFMVYTDGDAQGVSGTSASTPAVSGIIALVNDQLLAAGKRPLGFLNPFMYQNPRMFRDITKGYNDGGGVGIFKHGFYATAGWDPVTGLGTPNYPAIKAAALAAQA